MLYKNKQKIMCGVPIQGKDPVLKTAFEGS